MCDNLQGGENCDSSDISSKVARVNLFVGLCNNIPAFLLSGFYASLAVRGIPGILVLALMIMTINTPSIDCRDI